MSAQGETVMSSKREPEVAAELAELVARTDRLAPLYGSAIQVMTWGFRGGALLLGLGIVAALLKREPIGAIADPIPEIAAAVAAGSAAGIIDLAILWFMLVPAVTVLVAAISFWRLGDRRYATLSLIVLAILGASIALALNRS